MTLGEQAKWWGTGLAVFVLILFLLSGVLAPFVLGAAIAYFADPVADRLEARGLSRVLSTIIITLVALVVAVILLILLIPLLANQVRLALDALPGIVDPISDFIAVEVLPVLLPEATGEGSLVLEALRRFQEQLQTVSVTVLSSAWSIGLAGIEFVTLLVITPVVAFYLLMDWDRMIGEIDDMLPREHAPTIRLLASRVDAVMAGFVRGQLTVCLILGTWYALALTVIQLPFGLLVGLFAGLISFIPFVGSFIGGALSIGIALVHFWDDPVWIVATAVIFIIGQVVEGNFLTPKLVGGSVGLHPVWLMLALSAFGALFGFTGLLIAVPVAAVIGVFLRFGAERYKGSRLYRGTDE